MTGARAIGIFATLLALAGCALNDTRSTEPTDRGQPKSQKSYQFRDVAKTDIDLVAELHVGIAMDLLRELAEKLYRRNPREWRNAGQPGLEAAVARIFEPPEGLTAFPELEGRQGTEAILLAFDERYAGDRVLAFVGGLMTMTLDAYNGKREFFIPDSLDAQKLYNSARNFEIAAWKLAQSRRPNGELYLLSNALEGGVINLSYERQFGKLIAHQDMMARIIADRYNRSVTKVIQSVAQAIFLPI